MSAALRDPSAPVDLANWPRRVMPAHRLCGYTLDTATAARCSKRGLYLFRLASWPMERHGLSCADHANVVRSWDGLVWMRSARPLELIGAGPFTPLTPAAAPAPFRRVQVETR